MEIKVIYIAFATLGGLSLLIRRLVIHHPSSESSLEAKFDKSAGENQESNRIDGGMENRGKLDDSQATEIVATWNFLNPP